jgi:Sec-independent protein translocase protein TatA
MAVEQKMKDSSGSAGFVDSLREIQGEYIMLTELYEKEKSYGQTLSDMMRALQFEVDATIQIRPEAVGEPCRAAYLVSEAVVVVFDKNGGMSSKPLYRFSPNVIVSVIEECTPELRRLISEKRMTEVNKVRSLERVLKELKKAQATFKQSRKDELDLDDDEPAKATTSAANEDEETPATQPQRVEEKVPQTRSQKDSFAFKGSFGDKRDTSGISS